MSVGHVARAAEQAGISTVGIYVAAFRHVAEVMALPRTLVTRHPFGRPVGPVGDKARHRAVVTAALDMVGAVDHGGAVATMPGRFDAGRHNRRD